MERKDKATRSIVGGVDTHKDLHVAAVVDECDCVLDTRSFATTRQGYRLMLAWMPIEIAAKKEELLVVEARIQELLVSAEKDRGRVAKLEAKEQINAKEEERLKDYRSRLEKKAVALIALGSDIDAKKSALTDMTTALDARATHLDRRQVAQDQRAINQDARERAQEERAKVLERIEAEMDDRALAAASEAAALTSRTIAGIITGETFRRGDGKWSVTDVSDKPALSRIWKAILPALKAVHSWWSNAQEKINALPEPDRDALILSMTPPEDPSEDTDFRP